MKQIQMGTLIDRGVVQIQLLTGYSKSYLSMVHWCPLYAHDSLKWYDMCYCIPVFWIELVKNIRTAISLSEFIGSLLVKLLWDDGDFACARVLWTSFAIIRSHPAPGGWSIELYWLNWIIQQKSSETQGSFTTFDPPSRSPGEATTAPSHTAGHQ